MRIKGLVILSIVGLLACKKTTESLPLTIGQKIDEWNGVAVYYNGPVSHVAGRNVSKDGYNLGLKYQCVEFVKRYYYEALHHTMPNSYGHAKDFFDVRLPDGGFNKDRNLTQYTNPSQTKPKVNDLVVYGATKWNKYGHVAIICKVNDHEIEIIQQNPGPNAKSRKTYPLQKDENGWRILNNQILGWLRK